MISPHMSVDRMRRLIEDGVPDAWPEGWASWPATRHAMIARARDFAATLVAPDDVGSGRGIVTSAGPKHFPSLYVTLRRLRAHAAQRTGEWKASRELQ